MSVPGPLLEVRDVSKSFPGVVALSGVNFTLERGEIHALVGENGAGKSTLMKILSGAYQKDSGQVFLEGRPIVSRSPREAAGIGISIIYQELNLLPALSIAENIFLSHLPARGALGILDKRRMRRETAALLARVGLDIDPDTPVGRLRVAEQQLVEVAKALSARSRVLIMDEPTAALTAAEAEKLFGIIHDLQKTGVSVIYISHKLDEVFAIAQRITVLRDGEVVRSFRAGEADKGRVISLMVGRELTNLYPKVAVPIGGPVFEVEKLNSQTLRDISFSIRRGEILGVAGLMGAGQMALARALFGVEPKTSGIIRIGGRAVATVTPRRAIKLGVGLLTENRKEEGLVLGLSVARNIALASMDTVSRWGGLIARRAEERLAESYVERLSIRTPSVSQVVRNLSGGNQQKVVLAKWLNTDPDVVILCEPTRGIDVGAKAEIYRLIGNLARDGKAVLFISSELPELMGLADRLIVMHEGRIAAELSRDEATPEKIMLFATGGHVDA